MDSGADGRPARFLFILRRNIRLEGDLELARLELGSFFKEPLRAVDDLTLVEGEMPGIGAAVSPSALAAYGRPKGTQAFLASGHRSLLPALITSPAFVQRVLCLIPDTPAAHHWLQTVKVQVGPVLDWQVCGESLSVQAIPHYALSEFSAVLARRAKDRHRIGYDLTLMTENLLGRSDTPSGARLAGRALSAQSTTSHLTHDIHYYKAKFFPRLARAALNLCRNQLGPGMHRVIDPFVGSGTTLLEAGALGLPSLGLDLDPLSALISRVKLGALALDPDVVAAEADRARDALAGRPGERHPPLPFPEWLLKNRKMTPTLAAGLSHEIGRLQAAVAAVGPETKPVLQVLMSDAIARRLRFRFLGTGVGRFSLTLSKRTAPQIFDRSLTRTTKVLTAVQWLRETLPWSLAPTEVMIGDARCPPAGLGQFDILLTSPPYLPASSGRESYTKARSLSLLAVGLADSRLVDKLVDGAVGSMGDWGRAGTLDHGELSPAEYQLVNWLAADPLRGIKAEPTARYFLDMRRAFRAMAQLLRPGGVGVVVVGKQSTFYRFSTREPLFVVPAAELLAEEAHRAGLVVNALHDIQLIKANRNARPRSLDDYYETLILMHRPFP